MHHVVPVHVDGSKELDEGNLLTLCAHCHLLVGHLMLWASWNPAVREHCKAVRQAIMGRP